MSNIGLKFGAEGEREFKQALADINQNFKVLGSEMKLVSSQFDKNDKSVEALSARNEVLNKQIGAQKEKIAMLREALKNSADSFGENDKRTKNWQVQLNNAEAALNGMERELKQNAAEMDDAGDEAKKYGKSIEDAGDKSKAAGAKFEKAGQVVKSAAKAMAAATAAIGAAAVAAGKHLWDMSNEVAEAGDKIDKESQKLGLSAESYQELDYAMERCGAEVEDFKKGTINISKALAGVQNGAEEAGATFKELGVSLKNSDGSMRSTEDVLLDSIDALADMHDETKRNALANEIFGKSYTELAPLLNTGADGIKALMQEAHDYGMVMSDEAVAASAAFEDSLTKLKGTLNGVKNNMLGELLPGITTIMDGFSDLASGSDKSGSKLKEGIKQIKPVLTDMAKSLAEALGQVLPTLLDVGKELVIGLVSSIGEILPEVLPELFDVLFDLLDSLLTDGLPTILNSLMSVAGQLLDSFLEKFPQLLDKLINYIGSIDLGELLKKFLDAVEKIANMIAENLPTIITDLMNAIVNLIKSIDWKDLIQTGNRILLTLVDGFLDALPSLIDALPDLIEAIVDFLTDPETVIELVKGAVKLVFKLIEKLPEILGHLVSALFKAGGQLLQGLWEGISKAGSWLWEKITGFFGGIVDGIKSFFGIKSPSKLFRDQIGKNLALGIGEGFSDEMDKVSKDMKNAVPTDFDTEVQATVSGISGYGLNGFGGNDQRAMITQNFNVAVNVDSLDGKTDLDSLAVQLSHLLAEEIRRTEGVYA